MIRGTAKPYAARVKDGSNTITTAVSQKIFIQKVIAALVCIALDFTAPSLLSGISSNVILPVGDERDMGFCNPEYQLSSRVRFNSTKLF